MNPKIKDYVGIALIAALVVLVLGGLQFTSAYSKSVPPVATFQVNGEGRVVAIPDRAEFSFGIITEGGKNVAALQEENNNKTNAALDFVKSSGVDEKDIRTETYNISPRYQSVTCPGSATYTECNRSEIIGYTVSQMISVKVKDFAKIGDILSGVAQRGANNISSLNFTVHDKDAAENEARGEAMEQAQTKARDLAKAGNFRLGRIVSVSENSSGPIYYAKTQVAYGMGAEAAPRDMAANIQPGSDEIVKTVTVTYEIR